mgnify:CR=1 FL=1
MTPNFTRVANLLGVQPQADAGMPTRLALGSGTSTGELLAEANTQTEASRPVAATPRLTLSRRYIYFFL